MAEDERVAQDAEGWFAAVVQRADDIVLAIDSSGCIHYLNDAVRLWLGFEAEDWIGRNAFDLVHPDDAERALGSLSFMQAFDEPTAAAPFRVRHADGSWVSLDIGGRRLEHPFTSPVTEGSVDSLVVMICREASNADLADHVLEALATGAPLDHTLLLIARTLQHPLWGFRLAMYVRNDDGDEYVVDTAGDEPPIGHGVSGELPWDVARRTGERVFHVDFDALAPELRDHALSQGMLACWSVPVLDPLFDRYACLVVWSALPVFPDLGQGVALTRTSRLFGLALRERQQRVLLERAARRDMVTGLPNRTRFFHVLDEEMAHGGMRPAVLFIDLDGFKAVNDEHGHAMGDNALQVIGRRLTRESPEASVAARIGGDEFAVVLATHGETSVAIELAERIITAISDPITIDGITLHLGASVGIAVASEQSRSAQSLVAEADRAMYAAKRAGKGRWSVRTT